MRVALVALAVSVVALGLALRANFATRPPQVAAGASVAEPTVATPAAVPAPAPAPAARASAGPVSSAVLPKGTYRTFVAPPGVTLRTASGETLIETTDPTIAGTTVDIIAERSDGTTETLAIPLPRAR
jgi:hypothetical protein